MKIALAQLNYCIGNFEQNTKKIIDAALQAKADGADLVVFSELSVCGYFPFDCLEFDDFIEKCQKALDEIAEKCHDIPVLVGAPIRNDNEGQKPYVAAAGADTGLRGLGLYVFTQARSPPFAEASASLLVVFAFGCVVFAFSVCVACSCCAMSPTCD